MTSEYIDKNLDIYSNGNYEKDIMEKKLDNQSVKYFELVKKYESTGKCIAHFNISNLDQLRAICEVAGEMGEPVIIGVSEGERDYMGVKMVRAVVDEMKSEYNVPIYLNADHTYSLAKVIEVVQSGYDSVIVDGAKLPIEDNIKLVKESVEYVREYERVNGKRVLVEAELGYIGQSSSLNESLPEGVTENNMTSVAEALRFVSETGIDMFAPAVGNVHGMLVNAPEPRLHIERIREIKNALPDTPLVLHGASGNTDEDLLGAIDAGISIIHINTEIRKAFTDGIRNYLLKNLKDIAPYKYGSVGQEEMKRVVRSKIELYRK
jgi:fructose-bisphosphate aldolase, class II